MKYYFSNAKLFIEVLKQAILFTEALDGAPVGFVYIDIKPKWIEVFACNGPHAYSRRLDQQQIYTTEPHRLILTYVSVQALTTLKFKRGVSLTLDIEESKCTFNSSDDRSISFDTANTEYWMDREEVIGKVRSIQEHRDFPSAMFLDVALMEKLVKVFKGTNLLDCEYSADKKFCIISDELNINEKDHPNKGLYVLAAVFHEKQKDDTRS